MEKPYTKYSQRALAQVLLNIILLLFLICITIGVHDFEW